VSFSGGRDSSAVLAVATRLARREGLPDPIPSTLRAPQAPLAEESAWQELVVRHLELDDWQRRDLTDELDLVGPVARRALRRHGLLLPAQAYFHRPILEDGPGGSLLTGAGGNEMLLPPLPARAATGGVTARQAARAVAPRALLRSDLERRVRASFPWLRPDPQHTLADLWSREGREPLGWRSRLAWTLSRRWLAALRWSLDRLALETDTRVVHPLADEAFADALRVLRPRSRFTRTGLMRGLFGDLLPDAVLARPGRGQFAHAYWGEHTRRLVAEWSGGGVDLELVDPDALRRVWARGYPQTATSLLVQSAWLSADRTAPSDRS
jgi:asparagine synthase (glutamine-hydrolysing)